nr:serine hydrolase domain-containing protein [Thiocystis minor]
MADTHGPLGDIRVRHLLTHHAGLPGSRLKGMWNWRPEPASAVLATLREEASVYPPDLIFHYSNLGFALAGLIVERLSGKPFADSMERASAITGSSIGARTRRS